LSVEGSRKCVVVMRREKRQVKIDPCYCQD
jgi:hypothetical protein